MGYWLKSRLIYDSAITVGQTWHYKLPKTGLYSAFSIRIQCQRDADRNDAALVPMLHERITKVELVTEGTKVIKSMRAREIMALNLFDFGLTAEMQDAEMDGSYNMFTIYLLAGRSLQDKEYMFDMSKFLDPEIAITNDVSSDDGVDFDEATLEYQIFGWRWMGDPVPMPIGYMRADERLHYDTTGGNVEKVLQITRGKRIRRILIMGWEPAETITSHWKEAELQVNEGEYSPVHYKNMLEAANQNKIDYKLDIEVVRFPYLYALSTSIDVDACMCYPLSVQVTEYGGTGIYTCDVWGFDGGRLDVRSEGICEAMVAAKGLSYMTSVLMGFDKEKDLSDMLDTRDMGILKLIGTEQESGDTVSVVIEEEVLY